MSPGLITRCNANWRLGNENLSGGTSEEDLSEVIYLSPWPYGLNYILLVETTVVSLAIL